MAHEDQTQRERENQAHKPANCSVTIPVTASVQEYGIDWEAYDDHQIRDHNADENPSDHLENNPFVAHWPEQHSVVEVEAPDCPLNAQQLSFLDSSIQGLTVETMDERSMLWVEELGICRDSFEWMM